MAKAKARPILLWGLLIFCSGSALARVSERLYSIKKISGYDPIFYTLAAALESRDYPGPNNVTQIRLPWISEQTDFQNFEKPIPAFWHRQKTNSPNTQLIIVFGASFSTWKRGTWFKKTQVLGPKNYDYLFVPGFFTPEAIPLQPKTLDFLQQQIARDLYQRISDFLNLNSHYQRIGLVGFSGGANLAMQILALDAEQKYPKILAGAYLASPVLDLNSTLSLLEREHNQIIASKTILPTEALTTQSFVANQIAEKTWLAISGQSESDYQRVLRIGEDPSSSKYAQWKSRFFNEFWTVDLGYLKSQNQVALESVVPDFTQKFLTTGLKIKAPVYLVFALDDPILASENTEEILNELRKNPAIQVFSPSQGGHLGYILDNHFYEQSLKEFFSYQP